MKKRYPKGTTLLSPIALLTLLTIEANGIILLSFTDEINGLTLTSSGFYNLSGAITTLPDVDSIAFGSSAYANGSNDIIGYDTHTPSGEDTAYILTKIGGLQGGFTSNLELTPSSITSAPNPSFYLTDINIPGVFQSSQIVFNGSDLIGDASGSAVWAGQTISSAGLTAGYHATYEIQGTSERVIISVSPVPELSSTLFVGLTLMGIITCRKRITTLSS